MNSLFFVTENRVIRYYKQGIRCKIILQLLNYFTIDPVKQGPKFRPETDLLFDIINYPNTAFLASFLLYINIVN